MHKVYINDKPLIFIDDARSGLAIYDIQSIEIEADIEKAVKQLSDSTTLKGLVLVCKDENKAFDQFCKLYKPVLAAGGLVFNNDGGLLFIFRNGRWDLPKGKGEKGETIQETALREVEEECGIKGLNLLKKLCVTYHTYTLAGKGVVKESHWYLMKYSGKGKLKPQSNEGIEKAIWADTKEVPELLKNTFASIIDVWKQYLLEVND